jgi:hypothetical protein
MPVNTTYDEAFPSKWIKSTDIPEGKNLVLTITDVDFEPVGQDREMKLVLRFREQEDKGLVINKTNAETLRSLFGNDPNACIGQRIALFAQPVSFAGKMTIGVRIHPKQPPAPGQRRQAAPPPPPPPDEAFEDFSDEVYEDEMILDA